MGRSSTFDAKAIAEYCKSNSDVAAQIHFACSRATVTNACRQYNVQLRTEPDHRRKAVADWVAADPSRTLEDAMHEFGITGTRVRSACKLFGVHVTAARDTRAVGSTSFEILGLLWKGYSQSEVAQEIGCSRQRCEQVQRMAERHGLYGENATVQAKPQPQKQSNTANLGFSVIA